MMIRTQISLDPELHSHARERAGKSGVSLGEYVRRLIARDLGEPRREIDPSAVFNLGSSQGSDIAGDKDVVIGEAVAAEHKNSGQKA